MPFRIWFLSKTTNCIVLMKLRSIQFGFPHHEEALGLQDLLGTQVPGQQ